MKIYKEIKHEIEKLQEEGYDIKIREDTGGDITWASTCKCGGWTEGKDFYISRCKIHHYIPEFEDDEEEELDDD